MLQDDARDANGARGTVGNASLADFIAKCGESLPEYPRSAPLNACSRESHLSGNSWPTLPRTRSFQNFQNVAALALASPPHTTLPTPPFRRTPSYDNRDMKIRRGAGATAGGGGAQALSALAEDANDGETRLAAGYFTRPLLSST
jgi:hypothetical protein